MEQRAPADHLGRVLGVLGILIASGSSAYLYRENQQLKQRVAVVDDNIGTAERAKEFNQNWNNQLVTALQDFKTRGNKAIEKLDEEQSTRSRLFREELAKLPTPAETLDTPAIEAIVDRKLETLRKVAVSEAIPQLRVAQTVMKPIDDSDANVTVVANDGEAAADIKFISFRPMKDGQFEIDVPTKLASESEEDWVIRFLPVENTATQTGRHHHYERQLVFGERTVAAKSTVRVALEIENSKYVGWGLEGDLVIEYAAGRILTSAARAVFVASDTDSVQTTEALRRPADERLPEPAANR